jgi:hypothetical protein
MYLTQIGTKTKKTALYLLGKPRTKDEICVKYILPFNFLVGQEMSLSCDNLVACADDTRRRRILAS